MESMSADAAQDGPGHEAARFARHAIEAALLRLPDLAIELDRPALRDRLLRAVQYLHTAGDLPDVAIAHLEALDQAGKIADECRHILLTAGATTAQDAPPPEELVRACSDLAAAQEALGRAYQVVARHQFEHPSQIIGGRAADIIGQPEPFRVSLGVPRLHAIVRMPLLPLVDVEPAVPLPERPAPAKVIPLPPAASFEDLKAIADGLATGELPVKLLGEPEEAPEPPPERALPPWAYVPAVPEVDVLRTIARDCLEDIANSRTLRKPNAIETWLDQAPFEQRILDNLDTFVALGGSVLGLTMLFLAEAKIPDPERAFAVALVLGSIAGRDTVAAATLTFKQSAPETWPGWLEGFCLAPSPEIDRAMEDLAEGPDPAFVAFALDVLLGRGTLPDRLVRRHLETGDAAIALRIARALATRLPRSEAIVALEQRMAHAPHIDIWRAAAESLLIRGHGPVLPWLRAEMADDPWSERARHAAWLCCLTGHESDLEAILAVAKALPYPRVLRGLGRFGHPGAIPFLLEALSGERDEATAAAEALDRITGAGLREVVEEPWELDLPPNIDMEGLPVPMRKVERVVLDPTAWSAWLADAPALDPKVKYRGGAPFVPMSIVDELTSPKTPPARRSEAAEELWVVTGLATPFSTEDWVARQLTRLADAREAVAALGKLPGTRVFGLDRGRRHVTEGEALKAPHERESPAQPHGREGFGQAPEGPSGQAPEGPGGREHPGPSKPERGREGSGGPEHEGPIRQEQGPAGPPHELPSFMRALASAPAGTSARTLDLDEDEAKQLSRMLPFVQPAAQKKTVAGMPAVTSPPAALTITGPLELDPKKMKPALPFGAASGPSPSRPPGATAPQGATPPGAGQQKAAQPGAPQQEAEAHGPVTQPLPPMTGPGGTTQQETEAHGPVTQPVPPTTGPRGPTPWGAAPPGTTQRPPSTPPGTAQRPPSTPPGTAQRPPSTPPGPAAQPAGYVELTLAQYAKLWAAIWLDPPHEAQTRARYGVQNDAVWNAVRAEWQRRFRADPTLEQRFHHIVLTERAQRQGPDQK